MVEAIVHVGVHKTGTSSIQRVMRRHRDRLLEQGFLYPGFAPNHYDIHTAFCSNPLRYHMVRGAGAEDPGGGRRAARRACWARSSRSWREIQRPRSCCSAPRTSTS